MSPAPLRAPDGVMRFGSRLPNDTATLLLVARFIIVLVGLADAPARRRPATTRRRSRSSVRSRSWSSTRCGCVQYLRSASRTASSPSASRRGCRSSLGLTPAGRRRGRRRRSSRIGSSHALEPTIHTLHISQAFAGLVIVAIAGNAVENVAGIVLAAKGRAELAIAVVKNSVAQIAAFLLPVLVLVSLRDGEPRSRSRSRRSTSGRCSGPRSSSGRSPATARRRRSRGSRWSPRS